MSAALHLAKPGDLDSLVRLVAAFHDEEGIEATDDMRHAALSPLLEGSPYGAAYLVGPARAPIGYLVVTFTWSVEFGGLDAMIDEIFLRPAVRGRGIAMEVLNALTAELARAGVRAVHLEVDQQNESAKRLYTRSGFRTRENYALMSRVL
jgi:ribosomal protein S18 acetylase RimI-like enzyme